MVSAVTYRVVIPCVPDSEIGSNGRLHWAVKARRIRDLREFAGWHARDANPRKRPIDGPVVLRITVGWPKGRKRHDDDNMVSLCKAVIDGMTDAGWWHDDRQVSIARPIEQMLWSRWENQGGWLYPNGCMTIDVQEVDE